MISIPWMRLLSLPSSRSTSAVDRPGLAACTRMMLPSTADVVAIERLWRWTVEVQFDEGVSVAADELIERIGCDYLALLEDHDRRSQRLHLLEIVRRIENRGSSPCQVFDDFEKCRSSLDIRTGGRLVEQDERGIVEQCDGGVEAALLPSGQLTRFAVQEIIEAQGRGDTFDLVHQRSAWKTGQLCEQLEVVAGSHHRVDPGVLRGEADVFSGPLRMGDRIDAVDDDAAAVGSAKPADDGNEGCLTGAVRA